MDELDVVANWCPMLSQDHKGMIENNNTKSSLWSPHIVQFVDYLDSPTEESCWSLHTYLLFQFKLLLVSMLLYCCCEVRLLVRCKGRQVGKDHENGDPKMGLIYIDLSERIHRETLFNQPKWSKWLVPVSFPFFPNLGVGARSRSILVLPSKTHRFHHFPRRRR